MVYHGPAFQASRCCAGALSTCGSGGGAAGRKTLLHMPVSRSLASRCAARNRKTTRLCVTCKKERGLSLTSQHRQRRSRLCDSRSVPALPLTFNVGAFQLKFATAASTPCVALSFATRMHYSTAATCCCHLLLPVPLLLCCFVPVHCLPAWDCKSEITT